MEKEFIEYVGDLDGDRDVDVLTYVTDLDNMPQLGWHKNLRKGKFTFKGIRKGQSRQAVVDIDGDKDLDVVLAAWSGEAGLAIYETVSKAKAWKARWLIKGADKVYGVLAGDMDILAGGDNYRYEGNVNVFSYNKKKGSCSVSISFRDDLPRVETPGIRTADLDGDGDLDVIYPGQSTNLRWIENGTK